MSCFEWQNHLSDLLDGALLGSSRQLAEAHLEQCDDCHSQYSRFIQIKNQLGIRSRATLPVGLRQNPLGSGFKAIQWAKLSRTQWEQIPWFLRTPIEGLGIVFVILLGVSIGPKLRGVYEKNIERSLADMMESFQSGDGILDRTGIQLPLVRGHSSPDANNLATQDTSSSPSDEFNSESADADSDADPFEESDGSVIQVGQAEIWRFNIKTDSPHELRSQIVKTLLELKLEKNTRGLGGIEAPGGIQFDLVVPQALILPLKKSLQKLAPRGTVDETDAESDTAQTETFTWYKSKSKSPLQTGHVHLVIWLSQI